MTTNSRIEEFRRTPLRFVAAITGGGAQFIADYLAVPGASASLIEAVVPYSRTATDAFLGRTPESSCSEHTARLIASAAYERARTLEPESVDDVRLGLGATAALTTNRERKGDSRIHCAAISRRLAVSASLTLARNARTRADEERVAADFILAIALFTAQKINASDEPWREYTQTMTELMETPTLPGDEAVVSWSTLDPTGADFLYGALPQNDAPQKIRALRWTHNQIDRALLDDGTTLVVDAELERALRSGTGATVVDEAETRRRVIFPGSFNPPHQGHVQIVESTQKRLGTLPELELSARNVDKPPLDSLELLRRVRALDEALPGVSVWVSCAPRFVEKATLWRGATFATGADTILRLGDPKYEENSIERRDAVLNEIAALGTKFLVFNRKIAGRVESFEELRATLPGSLADVCLFADDQIADVSSTQLRKSMRHGG